MWMRAHSALSNNMESCFTVIVHAMVLCQGLNKTQQPVNGQRYPQQKPDLGEFPRQNTGEIKWLYGCGISDKIPPQTHSSPAAEVMASSKRGNKQEQPLLFHCWSSCARVEPSALWLNQYKCCALQPRTCLFRLPVIVSHRVVIGFNKQLHLSKKPSVWPVMHQWQHGWFPPPQ